MTFSSLIEPFCSGMLDKLTRCKINHKKSAAVL